MLPPFWILLPPLVCTVLPLLTYSTKNGRVQASLSISRLENLRLVARGNLRLFKPSRTRLITDPKPVQSSQDD